MKKIYQQKMGAGITYVSAGIADTVLAKIYTYRY
jgi:hypothetical protein